jgi:hypothetical protein
MCEPGYRDLPQATIPVVSTDAGVSVKVIAGSSQGTAGAMTREGTQPVYLDVHMPAGARFDEALPTVHNAFVYVYEGAVKVGDPAGTGNSAPRAAKKGRDGRAVHIRWRNRRNARQRYALEAAADRREAAARTDRAVRSVRDEYARAACAGGAGFSGREILNRRGE